MSQFTNLINFKKYGIFYAFIILVFAVTYQSDGLFVSPLNLRNILSQWSPAGIMAIGMTFVILIGGFDLSVGAAYALCAIVAAGLGQYGLDPIYCFIFAILAGGVIGAVNGLIVVLLRVNAFIATLGTSFAITGISFVVTHNRPYMVWEPEFSFLGLGTFYSIPVCGLLFVGLYLGGMFVLYKTIYGQWIYAAGGNYETSRLSGLPVKRIIFSTYFLSGLCAGIAGSIIASRLSSAQPNIDPEIVFDIITVVVLGGTSLAGGFGGLFRTLVGVGMVATIDNGIVLLDVDPRVKDIVKGVIIVLALATDVRLRNK